jgi:hypothetical protein
LPPLTGVRRSTGTDVLPYELHFTCPSMTGEGSRACFVTTVLTVYRGTTHPPAQERPRGVQSGEVRERTQTRLSWSSALTSLRRSSYAAKGGSKNATVLPSSSGGREFNPANCVPHALAYRNGPPEGIRRAASNRVEY